MLNASWLIDGSLAILSALFDHSEASVAQLPLTLFKVKLNKLNMKVYMFTAVLFAVISVSGGLKCFQCTGYGCEHPEVVDCATHEDGCFKSWDGKDKPKDDSL